MRNEIIEILEKYVTSYLKQQKEGKDDVYKLIPLADEILKVIEPKETKDFEICVIVTSSNYDKKLGEELRKMAESYVVPFNKEDKITFIPIYNPWISIQDAQPKEDEEVLAYSVNKGFLVGYINYTGSEKKPSDKNIIRNYSCRLGEEYIDNVTHFMYLNPPAND